MFNKIKAWFCSESLASKNLGLSIIRIGIGLVFIRFGFEKLMAGPEMWHTLGCMAQYVGISFWPTLWGFLAGCAEFFGGIMLVVGFWTRLASVAIALVMLVATTMHYRVGDPWMKLSLPLSLLFVMIGLLIAGGGSFSVDSYIHRKNQ